ncbi:MAG TPA: ribokinase [Candidatus Dormibacteraeota bacterium]|nr:ribokinase [Candidatus Dormibacteraeota bacterium]
MARIVVLGSLNVDLVVTVPRLPQPGETVLGDGLASYPGGKGANQAVAAARLGGQVAMVGRVGTDRFAAGLIENLDVNHVDSSGVERDPAAPTGAALIYVEAGGQNMIAVAPGANATVSPMDAQRAVSRLGAGDVLAMQLEIPVAAVKAAVTAARKAGAHVLLNAAPAHRLEPGLLRQLDALVLNEREANALIAYEREATLLADHDDPSTTAAALRTLGPRLVIVTLGPTGSLFCDETGVHRVEPFPVKSIDATGAGDAFMGALAVGIARGLPTEAAVRFGNAAGAAATSSVGAQAALPRLEDLHRLFGVDVPSLEA